MTKRNLFLNASAEGKFLYCWGSWRSLRCLWEKSLFLGEGLADRGLLGVDNKDALETGAGDTGRHWPPSPHAMAGPQPWG